MDTGKKGGKEESFRSESYRPDFEEEERINTEKSDRQSYEYNYQNSLSIDREVSELSQNSEIEWQNDINLFDNNRSMSIDLKH